MPCDEGSAIPAMADPSGLGKPKSLEDVLEILRRDQIDFFHEHGYLAIERLMPQDEVPWMRGIYDRLFAVNVRGMAYDTARALVRARYASPYGRLKAATRA